MDRLDINVIKNISLYLNNIDYIALKRTSRYMTNLPTSHLVAYRLARKILSEKEYISNKDLVYKLKKYIDYYDFDTIEDKIALIEDLTYEFEFKQKILKKIITCIRYLMNLFCILSFIHFFKNF